jgi:hypothetical protein
VFASGFQVRLLSRLESVARVLECLPRMLVSGQMIALVMSLGRGPMRMGGKIVVFGDFLV